jgi:DNA-binding transcriptional regulator YiaG
MDLIRQLKEARTRLELSQEGLARRLGVSVRTIVRWEQGDAAPSPLAVERLRLFIESQKES